MGRGRTTYWTLERIVDAIQRVMQDMEIEHLPRCQELKESIGIDINVLRKFGGLKAISNLMDVPLAPVRKPKHYERKATPADVWDRLEPFVFIPSKAFELEREARKDGLHYADIQKQNCPVEPINLADYAGMKTWEERQVER